MTMELMALGALLEAKREEEAKTKPEVKEEEKVQRLDREAFPIVMKKAIYANANITVVSPAFHLSIGTKEEGGRFIQCFSSRSAMPNNTAIRNGLIKISDKLEVMTGMIKGGKLQTCFNVSTVKATGRIKPSYDVASFTFGTTRLAEEILYRPIWFAQKDGMPVLLSERKSVVGATYYFDILADRHSNLVPELNGEWVRYRFLEYTPAKARLNSCVLLNTVELEDGKYVVNDLRPFYFMNIVSCGAVRIFNQKGMQTKATLIKWSARPAQRLTYTEVMGVLQSTAILNGSFAVAGLDGMSFVRASILVPALRAQGFNIKEEDLIGTAVQGRPGMAKAMVIIVSDAQMTMLCKVLKKRHEGGFDFHGEASTCPDFIADDMCWKANIDPEAKDLDFDVLAPVTAVADPALNIQLVAKLVGTPEFPQIMKESFELFMDKEFSLLSADKTAKISDMSAALGAQALMRNYLPFAMQIEAVKTNALDTMVDAAFKKLLRFNMPIKDAKWMTFCGDFACLFGKKILKENEVLSKELKGSMDVDVVRFPSVFPREFFQAVTVSPNTYISRVLADADFSKDEKELLISLIKSLDAHLLVTPDFDTFRIKTGGADYDTDKGIVIWNKTIVSAFSRVKSMAVEGTKAKPSKALFGRYNPNSSVMSFLSVIQAEKIGKACNNLTACIEQSTMPAIDQIMVMSAVIGVDPAGKEHYTAHFNIADLRGVYCVTPEQILQARDDMRKADLHDDATRAAILFDCLVIAKTEVDRIVDAPKNADQVEFTFIWNNKQDVHVKTDLFDNIVLGKAAGQYVVSNLDGEFCGGAIADIRHILIDTFLKKVNGIKGNTATMSEALFDIISQESGSKICSSYVALKMLYSSVAGLKRSDRDALPAGADDFVLREQVRWAKAHYAAISNMGRMMAKELGYDEVQLATAVLAASADEKLKMSKVIKNLFASTLFAPELMRFAEKYYGKNGSDVLSERLYVVNNAELVDGEILVLTGGVAKRGEEIVAVTKAKLNGSYKIELRGKKAFAVQSITEMFAVPETNGSFVVNVHAAAIKEAGGAKKVYDLLKAAANITVSTPNRKGYRDELVMYNEANEEIGRLRITMGFSSAVLCKMLDCTVADVIDVKAGVIDAAGRAYEVVQVLMNKTGVIDKGAIRKDIVVEANVYEEGSFEDYEELGLCDEI